MPEITKGLLKAALDRYHERLALTLSIVEPLGPPGDIDRMFRDVAAISQRLVGLYQAEMAEEQMRAQAEADKERRALIEPELHRQRSGQN